jgi:hypothetical protein
MRSVSWRVSGGTKAACTQVADPPGLP